MPNQPRPDNKGHSIRIDDGLWAASAAEAERRGETISDAVRRALRRYVKEKK